MSRKIKYIHEREIWLAQLDPTKGIEMKKTRPCLIVRKFSQQHLIVFPLTTNTHGKNNIEIKAKFLLLKSFAKIDQIRAVDISRFVGKRMGKITEKEFQYIKKISAEILRFPPWGPNGQNEDNQGCLQGQVSTK